LVSGKTVRYALRALSLILPRIQIIQKLIDRFGLPWAYRFMALSFMVFGIVRFYSFCPLNRPDILPFRSARRSGS
jgi:hypothetical protein